MYCVKVRLKREPLIEHAVWVNASSDREAVIKARAWLRNRMGLRRLPSGTSVSVVK